MLQILIIFLDPECHYVRGIWCVTCDYSSVVKSKLRQTIESSCYVCHDDKQRLSVLEQISLKVSWIFYASSGLTFMQPLPNSVHIN
jgi:hypothetical protein